MANARKPDNVHKLNGTYNETRHGNPDDKPQWSTDLPEMPDYLDETAQAEWVRTMEDAPAGVLTKTDRTILAQYCLMVSKMIQSLDDPDISFRAADHTQLRMMQQELGFTPSARGKIGGKPKTDDGSGFQSNPR